MHLRHESHYNSRRNLATQFFATGGTTSNHTTTIIIIVVCAAAGMFILFCLFRLFRNSWARGSTPLPPMQPIALYREQRLTEFVERRNSLETHPRPLYLSPPLDLSPAASDSSSLPLIDGETFPSRKSSLYTAEKGDLQGAQPPLAEDLNFLQNPSAPFSRARRFSSSSLGSTPSTPPSASAASSSILQATLPCPYPHRAASAASRTSRRSTRSSVRNTVVGVPHGPHSQVKVILPSPLAPSLHPYMSEPEEGWSGVDGSRMSVVDMWAPQLHRSVSSDHIRPNPPTMPGTHWCGAPPSNTRRRTSSYHVSPSSYHPSSTDPPPVPPIPTQHNRRVT
ncbi:hypothetical protein M405DRAFT_434861 [Rhizopogon salebrosus TDB-379]|nr:hypothetical protein M405DRAFT_434861 [Rhizopogon salebrosus TDB-379]